MGMRAALLYKVNSWMINECFKMNYIGYNLDKFWQKTSFLCSVGGDTEDLTEQTNRQVVTL